MSLVARVVALTVLLLVLPAHAATVKLLNASYDPTRELYQSINEAFARQWESNNGVQLDILQSHGGSGKQARAVIEGLQANVVTLALGYDIDAIARISRLLPTNWQERLPHNSCPYTSTIVFLVRKGNPKQVRDWDDLIKPGIAVVTPNPKSSGGARWNYLAAWGFALKQYSSDQNRAFEFVSRLYENVPVLDTGARAATTTFAQRGIGDVLITWENEAHLCVRETGADGFQIVYPSTSILTEPPVAWVDQVNRRKGTEKLARAYLEFLYTDQGQEIIARNFYRPRNSAIAARYSKQFPSIDLFTVDQLFGGWASAHRMHFQEDGLFDRIQQKRR